MTPIDASRSNLQQRRVLERWYRTSGIGRRLREQIADDMRVILDEWFGYHMVIVGADADIPVGEMTRVQHITNIVPSSVASGHGGTDVIALDEELPLATESVDVVVLVNALELSPAPHQLLREVQRILVPHGHLLVVGSNAVSVRGVWRGLTRFFRGSAAVAPMGPSVSKLEDWLNLLDFAVATPRHKLVLPFSGTGRFGRWLGRVDQWLVEHNIPLGASYVVYANKTVRGHIQPRVVERSRARLMGLPVAKPVVGARESVRRESRRSGPRDHLRPVD